MKQKSASCPELDVFPGETSFSLHDFNAAAMVENYFGQGDDSQPIDPMADPNVVGIVRSLRS
jgi:hypothetical protein